MGKITVAALAVLTLLLVSCAGSNDAVTEETATPTASASTSSETPSVLGRILMDELRARDAGESVQWFAGVDAVTLDGTTIVVSIDPTKEADAERLCWDVGDVVREVLPAGVTSVEIADVAGQPLASCELTD